MRKAGDVYRAKLKDVIERKQEDADMKREARLGNLQDRIRKHVRHSISHLPAVLSFLFSAVLYHVV